MITLADLTACGAHRRGHFRLSSGLHSGDYLQCALFLADPARARRAGDAVAAAVQAAGLAPGVVVSPALGGVIIGHETARALGVEHLFTERTADGTMALRRGFVVPTDRPALVVEDVVTTGRSTREVIALLNDRGARVVGVGALVDRSGSRDTFAPLPFVALVDAVLETWPPEECPLCRAGEPLDSPGSRPG